MGVSVLALQADPDLKGEFADKLPGRFSYINPSKPELGMRYDCLLYTSPSPRDRQKSRMPSSA